MELEYRYSKLDKQHQYQLTGLDITFYTAFNQWVYFYLGKYLMLRKNETLLPYSYEPTKVLGNYRGRFARDVAKRIVSRIKNHRKIRRIK